MQTRDVVGAFIVLAFTLFVSASVHAQGVQQQVGQPKEPTIETLKNPKDKQPKPEQKRPNRWGEPTEVRVQIYVIDVDGVDSANQNFSSSIYIEARWDMPLLRHKGPAPLIKRTTEVWTPRLVIVNQQQSWSAFPSRVEISPDGEVTYRQKTWGWFSQPLALRDFPLDRQTLTIHLVAAGLRENQVKMVPLLSAGNPKSGLAEKFSMPDFKVTGWKAVPRPYIAGRGKTIHNSGLAMDIEVQRLPSYYVWKIIFPLCLILMMSWVPRWLDPKESGTNISISTTAFLTLVAYLFAVTALLPRIAYLTRLDQFILLSTILVFVGLLQTVISTYLTNLDKHALVRRINQVSQIANPILLLIVLLVSFA